MTLSPPIPAHLGTTAARLAAWSAVTSWLSSGSAVENQNASR